MLQILQFFSITFFTIHTSVAQFFVKPKPHVVMLGKKVKFECAVNSFIKLDWSFGIRDKVELISHGPSVYESHRSQYQIEEIKKSKVEVYYNLIVLNATLQNAGIYMCTFNRVEMVTSLTVLKNATCHNKKYIDHIDFICMYSFYGTHNFTSDWNCLFGLRNIKLNYKTVSEKNQEIYQMITTAVVGEMDQRLLECNNTIRSGTLLSRYRMYPSLNFTPPFQLVLFPVTLLTLSITNLNMIKVNTEVTCAAESNLEVNFKVRLYEGSIEKSSDSNSSASLTFKKIGIFHVACIAKNGLNALEVITIVKNISVVSAFNFKCLRERIENCTSALEDLFSGKLLPTSSIENHKLFCVKHRRMFQCLQEFRACELPEKVMRVSNMLKFFCNGVHGQLRYMKMSVEERFPHVLLQKFLFFKSADDVHPLDELTNTFEITKNLVLEYCERLKKTAYVLAEVSYSSTTLNSKAGDWAKKFFQTVVGLKIDHVDHVFNAANQKYEKLNCEEMIGRVEFCNHYKKCISVYTKMLKLFNYGYTFVKDKEELLNVICELDERDFDDCNEFTRNCNNYVETLVSPFKTLRNILCDVKNTKIFFRYSKCFLNIEEASRSEVIDQVPLFECTVKLERKLTFYLMDRTSTQMEKETQACYLAKMFLDCIQKHVLHSCKNALAARFQRSIARRVFFHGMQNIFCKPSLMHTDQELYSCQHPISTTTATICFIVALTLIFVIS